MKLLHTSDWHIGRQFHGLSLIDDQRHILRMFIELVEAEQPDVVVIAGDVYDRAVPSAEAVQLLDETLNQLCSRLGITVIMISGNHDSATRLGFAAQQLAQSGLHIISHLEQMTQPIKLQSNEQEMHVYGIPYSDPEAVRHHFDVSLSTHDEAHQHLLAQINEVLDDSVINVLLSHCFVHGSSESESERLLSIGGSDRVSFQPMAHFDYVALGHLHGQQQAGVEHIRYAGSILKYSFSEQHHNKGVTCVTFKDHQFVSHENKPLSPMRNVRVLEGALQDILERAQHDPHRDDFICVRMSDTQAIVNPMGRLRAVYPNALKLEKTVYERQRMALPQESGGLSAAMLKKDSITMFDDFFQQMKGTALTHEQSEAIKDIINELDAEETQ